MDSWVQQALHCTLVPVCERCNLALGEAWTVANQSDGRTSFQLRALHTPSPLQLSGIPGGGQLSCQLAQQHMESHGLALELCSAATEIGDIKWCCDIENDPLLAGLHTQMRTAIAIPWASQYGKGVLMFYSARVEEVRPGWCQNFAELAQICVLWVDIDIEHEISGELGCVAATPMRCVHCSPHSNPFLFVLRHSSSTQVRSLHTCAPVLALLRTQFNGAAKCCSPTPDSSSPPRPTPRTSKRPAHYSPPHYYSRPPHNIGCGLWPVSVCVPTGSWRCRRGTGQGRA